MLHITTHAVQRAGLEEFVELKIDLVPQCVVKHSLVTATRVSQRADQPQANEHTKGICKSSARCQACTHGSIKSVFTSMISFGGRTKMGFESMVVSFVLLSITAERITFKRWIATGDFPLLCY